MNKIKHYVLTAGAVLIGVLLWSSCSRDETPLERQGDTSWVSFTLDIPGAQIPVGTDTRSMANGNEDAVREIDLLLFDATKTAPTFLERISLSSSQLTQVGTTVTFRAKMNTRTQSTLIMAVANASAVLDGLNWISTSSTKREILGSLIARQTGSTPGDWKWNAASDNTFTPIPMYGEKQVSSISPAMAAIAGVSLTRMLARIDVSNSATSDFTLKKIHLVNHYISGFVSPPFDDDGVIYPDRDPYVIGADKKEGGANALSYAHDDNSAITSYEGEIYAFEATKTSDSDESARQNSTCLILEGEYKGNTYFYRVDFTAYSESPDLTDIAYLPLKRNCKYSVDITSVEGIGYIDIDKAIQSYTMISNMKTRIIPYELSSLKSIVYNGQYMLGIGTDEMTLPSSGTPGYVANIPVLTNYTGGWTATIVEGADWLTFTDWPPPNWDTETNPPELTGNANKMADLRFKWTTPITGTVPRVAKIKVITNDNRLVNYLTITQNPVISIPTQPTITFLDEYGVELPIAGYFTDGGVTYPVYQVLFGLHIGEAQVPSQRIYVKITGSANVVYFGGFTRDYYGNPPAVIYNPSPTGTSPYPNGHIWGDGGWYDTAYYFTESVKGYDIEVMPRSAGEENIEFKNRDMFIVVNWDPWNDATRAYLDIIQSDWIQFTDLEDYLLGHVDETIGVKASAPWRIKSITENRIEGPTFTSGQRNLLAETWDSALLGTAPNPYLAVGATGGAGATSLNPVTNTLSVLTEKWLENRRGNVTVVFEATDGSGLPDKALTFEVFEKHLDYTYEEGVNATNTPFFYVHPINRSTDQYVYNSADPNYANVCTAIGSGWRLPTMNESMMMSSYRQALLTSNTAFDVHAQDGTYHPYGFTGDAYWTLARSGSTTNYFNLAFMNGYTEVSPRDAAKTYGLRCVYTPKAPGNYSASDPNVPQPPATGGKVYPWIDKTTDPGNGPIIVSRESGSVGVNTYSILPSGGSTAGTYDNLATHRVAAKLQVANTDQLSTGTWTAANNACANKSGTDWRLPTYREALLIVAVGGGGSPASGLSMNNVYSLGDMQNSPGFVPLAPAAYWTLTENDANTAQVWSVSLSNLGFWPPPKTYADGDIATRCVRTVN